MDKTYYITTPIYYPSDKLHIGHSYTTVAADAMARYKRMRGYNVKFLTGTDEHGQKIERRAKEAGVTPQVFVDRIVEWIKNLWKTMDIEYDIFIRTTDKHHEEAVKKIFKRMYDNGDIYKGHYEGHYCTPCETFFTERQLTDGKCPDCGRDVELVREEAYFFKLSKYGDRIIKHIEENPNFILPRSRQNEMINNFLKPGLEDLCVSRTSFTWGVPVEFDPGHVVYVWIDALSNYITALGFTSDDESDYKKYWPADVHLVGKEIVRFHTIIWPAMLMSMNEPLPKQIFGHGWLIIDGMRMAKSKGNVVDPSELVSAYGVDAIRYFLLREIPFGSDGNFTNEALISRLNSDLANDLGNLLSRTVGMIDKYFGGTLPSEQSENDFDAEIKALVTSTITKVEECMEELMFSDALTAIWTLIRRMNKYTDENQPWILAKTAKAEPEKSARLAGVMYTLAEALRIISVLIAPFMPNTPAEIHAQLNMPADTVSDWDSAKTFGLLPKTVTITKGKIVFPRVEIKADAPAADTAAATKEKQPKPEKTPKAAAATTESDDALITIDDFAKVKMATGLVLECERVQGSDKLLKSQIRIGSETRQIVSGIAAWYTPEQMVGKRVVVVTNLKPVKLRGVLSQGMILAASDENGNLSAVTTDNEITDGAEVR